MARNREEVKVGAMIVVAVVIFLTTLIFVGGVNLFRQKRVVYTAYFKFAGGLEPGSFVRFGGLKVGVVRDAEIDPEDSTRVRVHLLVNAGTPIRTDSRARISSLGFLGENYVEVSPGTREADRLPPGSEIPVVEIIQLADVFNNANNVTVNANKLVNDLDDRLLVTANNANQLIASLNALVGKENRAHVESTLANLDEMTADARPRVRATLANFDAASAKLSPTIENANAAIGRANALIANLDSVVTDNRAELREELVRLRDSLLEAHRLLAGLNDAVAGNRENLDESLENIRAASENLKEFTDTVRQKPFSLVRIKPEKERVPPTGQ